MLARKVNRSQSFRRRGKGRGGAARMQPRDGISFIQPQDITSGRTVGRGGGDYWVSVPDDKLD
jgi:hypothetical protein